MPHARDAKFSDQIPLGDLGVRLFQQVVIGEDEGRGMLRLESRTHLRAQARTAAEAEPLQLRETGQRGEVGHARAAGEDEHLQLREAGQRREVFCLLAAENECPQPGEPAKPQRAPLADSARYQTPFGNARTHETPFRRYACETEFRQFSPYQTEFGNERKAGVWQRGGKERRRTAGRPPGRELVRLPAPVGSAAGSAPLLCTLARARDSGRLDFTHSC